ncbi:Oligodendrocyte-myelin glycoprotein [Chlamydotis macqueenii]|uniref:Oligodendrocyte-myelin glycoprotein n=1 Tax=Chlamydotis macqueenii TaxID=187382 RepID=A0A091LQC3_9AVES|nr:PREDICTED: oligodendrocyte-myelin glycoprotein [Chlamydotis macqueenii]KFP45001.1 Oligodendrocyte-myelin glycoprotein [Chlamydotis macqueenii]
MEYQILNTSTCLLVLFFIPTALGICPSNCTCSGNDRNVDCSGRNLTILPHGLQDNITHLNLSCNQFVDLDHQLTRFTNLRTLDISNNWLKNVPAHLPKSLWELYAINNNIKVLQKLDTAYQWNLKVLDVSRNMVERAVLINNTLSSLKFLNLSSNKLWTVPTNMPYNIETVDLSNNFLSQILPGTLLRLHHLTSLYLHNNKFTYIPDKAFDQLFRLQVVTLYNNPWSCSDKQNIPYLLKWVQGTAASIVGAPCANQSLLWLSAAPTLAAPTVTDAGLMIKGMKAADKATSPVATEPTKMTKMHKQFKAKEVTTLVTSSRTALFTSTDRPLLLYPEDLPTRKVSSQEAAATHTIYIEESTEGSSSLTPSTGSSTTPMTLSITSGMPTNYSKMPPSTTATLRNEEPTTNVLNTRVPSKASISKTCLVYVVLLNAVTMFIG